MSFLRNHAALARANQAEQPAEDGFSDWFTEPEPSAEPTGRIDGDVELPLDAPVEANPTAKPPRWAKNDVRGQILTSCVRSRSTAEIAAALSLPLGATRFLVGELVTQGYLRVLAAPGDAMTLDERRELLKRTLAGLRAL
ncbi:DUF742 domain-containing protein [Mycolicibacterium sp. 120270]|nr:DUF742 domain-containing protein [Mycolicibacterium sp. 120270]MDX1884732.1 DUF742 domain-containing protein [Mycolicibacterium sp. 120270]